MGLSCISFPNPFTIQAPLAFGQQSQISSIDMVPTVNKLALADVHNPNISQARYDPVEEERLILKYWEEIDAFNMQLKKSEGRPRYSFYDG